MGCNKDAKKEYEHYYNESRLMGLHIVVLMDVFELRKEAMRQLSNEFCHQKIAAEPTSPYKKGTDLLIIMEKTNRWF